MAKDTKIKDTKRVIIDWLDSESLNRCFARWNSEGAITRSRDYIPLYADEACVKACEYLYDSGIYTINSGANVDGKENVVYEGFIGLDYLSLSEENKKIVNELVSKGIIKPVNMDPKQRSSFTVYLRVPLTSESTVGEVEEALLELAKYFKRQDVLYGRTTEEEIRSKYKDNGDGTYYTEILFGNISKEIMEEWVEEELNSLFYDGEKYYYLTEELLEMHLAYLQENDMSI